MYDSEPSTMFSVVGLTDVDSPPGDQAGLPLGLYGSRFGHGLHHFKGEGRTLTHIIYIIFHVQLSMNKLALAGLGFRVKGSYEIDTNS